MQCYLGLWIWIVNVSSVMWRNLLLMHFVNVMLVFTKKDVLCYFTHCNKSVEFVTKLFILSV